MRSDALISELVAYAGETRQRQHACLTRPAPQRVSLVRPLPPQADTALRRGLARAELSGARVLAFGERIGEDLAWMFDEHRVRHLTICDALTAIARSTDADWTHALDSAAVRAAARQCDTIVIHLRGANPGSQGISRDVGLACDIVDVLLRKCALMAPQARVIASLGGELGLSVIDGVFDSQGYRTRVLHDEPLALNLATDLHVLRDLEARMRRFEFWTSRGFDACELYADARAQDRVSAHDAWVLAQEAGFRAFTRRWYVIEGRSDRAAC